MAIDAVSVGSNQRQVTAVGDPTTASQIGSVLPIGDATSLSGLFAPVDLAVPFLQNPAGTYDRARSAPGTTGIPSVNVEGTKQTFWTTSLVTSFAATATDIWTLVGSGTKTVRLLRLVITGFATSGISVDMLLIKRSVADTGGTATQPTIIPTDSNNAAATAVANLYSANPTMGAAVGTMRARKLNLGATGAAGTIEWLFGDKNDQSGVLRGVTQSFCLNFNGQAIPSGMQLDIEAEFTEE